MRSTVSGEGEVAVHVSIDVRLSQRLRLAPAPGWRSSPRGFEGPAAGGNLAIGSTGRCGARRSRPPGFRRPWREPAAQWERRAILIRTRWKVVRRALLASAVGGAGLLAGCTDSNKSDGQIQASPEASNAAQAIAKSYGEQMAKKYGDKMKKRP